MSLQEEEPTTESTATVDQSWRNRVHGSSASLQGISPIISETDDTITIRQPVHYHSISPHASATQSTDVATRATLNRYKYYSRLDPSSGSSLLMPNHVVPSIYYLVIPVLQEEGTQHSIITIFSIWNTMVGTSVLSMPWALEKAGFGFGIGIMVLLAAISLYTAYRVMSSVKALPDPGLALEFTDVCQYYLGRWGRYTSIAFSLLALLGAAIVYWVLMANFLYNSVKFIHDEATHQFDYNSSTPLNNYTDAFCPHPPPPPAAPPNHTTHTLSRGLLSAWSYPSHQQDSNTLLHLSLESPDSSVMEATANHTHEKTTFEKVWNQTLTVPFFLIFLVGPFINMKSPTFFTKFNSLGTVSVLYILTFVAVKAAKWGIHLDFDPSHADTYIPEFQWSFPALTGTLSLAFFIHNCVLSIVRNQRNPENNGRDLSIAFVCVAFTYIFIGVLFYASYPLDKRCIEDNLLNNFKSNDIMSFVARCFLLFQMVTVFPLLMYIVRAQFLDTFFGSLYPSLKHVIAVNICVIALCLVFAVFLPHIGHIISFSGALCGLFYIFALPCIVYMMERREAGTLTLPVIIFHSILIVMGVANFIGQFVIVN